MSRRSRLSRCLLLGRVCRSRERCIWWGRRRGLRGRSRGGRRGRCEGQDCCLDPPGCSARTGRDAGSREQMGTTPQSHSPTGCPAGRSSSRPLPSMRSSRRGRWQVCYCCTRRPHPAAIERLWRGWPEASTRVMQRIWQVSAQSMPSFSAGGLSTRNRE